MWIFTTLGFFSVVRDRKSGSMPDSEQMLVRSRDRRHLENLRAKFNLTCPIRDNEGTDYAYRMSLPKDQWAEILAELASEQEYTNFKNEAANHRHETGDEYVRALHDVWSVMLELQMSLADGGSNSSRVRGRG
jgi:hypothetical protein